MTIVNRTSVPTEQIAFEPPAIGQWVIICDSASFCMGVKDTIECTKARQPFVLYELVPDETETSGSLVELARLD